MGRFPFGSQITALTQSDRTHKDVFVLGVYASAVHARWRRADGSTAISAMAVASEPEIFWTGEGAERIIAEVQVPEGAGSLVPASATMNGPSGRALDEHFLAPLGIGRDRAWLCDLLPESRCNPSQREALEREYLPNAERWGLPDFDFPPVPATLSDDHRRSEIKGEVLAASPRVLITLGDQPLKWFAAHHGARERLSEYGTTPETYGMLHDIEIAGLRLKLLPLVHPRQAGSLGSHSPMWRDLHLTWAATKAGSLI